MKYVEYIKLRYRAYKYKTKNDPGGISYLSEVIKSGQTVFDIGAHKGGYLFYFQQLAGKTGKVEAFEPQTQLYQYLQNLKIWFKWHNTTIHHMALSDSIEEVQLYIPTNKITKGSSPGASLLKPKQPTSFDQVEQVATTTLDYFCSTHHIQPHFLKIDVEGNELKIFEGGITTLKSLKPKILVEIEARHVGQQQAINTFTFLQNLGYRGFFLHHSQRTPLEKFSFDTHQNPRDPKNYCNNFIFE